MIDEWTLEHTSSIAITAMIERVVAARAQMTGKPLLGKVLGNSEDGTVVLIAPESELPFWLRLVRQFDTEQAVSTLHYAPRRFGLSETARLVESVAKLGGTAELEATWMLVEDRLTGTLIITASRRVHGRIQDLFRRLLQSGKCTFPIPQ